jgi:hypothetical protein
MFTTPGKPETKVVKDAMGNEHIVQITDAGDGGQPQGQAQGQPQGQHQPGFDGFYGGFLAPHEGGYTPSDGNGAPANFGVNQKANPDVDVRNLTPQAAKQIMHDRYWVPSGADKLPPGLAEIQGDTAVNMGVSAAQQLLQQSGGDPAKYLQLREQRYRAIAQNDPSKAQSLPGWLQRNQELGQYVQQAQQPQGGQGQAQGQGHAAGQPNVREIYSSAPPPPDPATAGLTGDDFLKTMSPARAKTIRAYANGDLALPTGRSAGSPQVQKLVEDVMQYDPSASATNLQSRQSTRKAFTSGPYSQTISATNTVIGHLGSLNDAVDRLNNTDLPWYNKTAQGVLVNSGNKDVQGALADFNTYKTMVANELTKVYRGSSGAEADIQGWLKQLDTAQSPTALKHTIKAMVEGLGSRIDALGTTYSQGMGRTEDPFALLNPRAVATLQKLKESVGIDAPPPPGRAAPAQPSTTGQPGQPASAVQPPRPGMVVKGYRFNGGNPADKANWVKVQ